MNMGNTIKHLLALFFFLSMVQMASALDIVVDGIYYAILSSNRKTMQVTKSPDKNYCGDITIPQTITYGNAVYEVVSIGIDAFKGCSDLTSVNWSFACDRIEASTFEGCCNLNSVGDLSSCTSIGNKAFDGCSSLNRIGALSSCIKIGEYAFRGCSSLGSVSLPSVLETLGYGAFSGCAALRSVTCEVVTPLQIVAVDFDEVPLPQVRLLVPEASVADYKKANIWKKFGTILSIESVADFIEGDANGDGQVSVGDVVAIINHRSGTEGKDFNLKAADVNRDEEADNDDISFLINYLLRGTSFEEQRQERAAGR